MEPFFLFLAIVIFYVVRGAVRSQGRAGIDPHDRPPDESVTSERMVEAQERALAALQRWEARQGLGEGAGRRTRSLSRERRDYRESSSPLRIRELGPEASSAAPLREDRRQAYAEIARLLDPERRPARRPAPGPAEARPVADGREAPRAAVEGRRLRSSRRDTSPIDSESAAVPTPRDRQSPLARLERLPLPVRAIVYAEILQRPHRR